jgi:hypothetical protein
VLGGRFAVRHEIFEEQSRLVTSRFAWRPDASESFPLPPAETRMLALRALRELLDNDDPGDWDDLVACYRALTTPDAVCRCTAVSIVIVATVGKDIAANPLSVRPRTS